MHLIERESDVVELRVSLSQLKKVYLALFRDLHNGGGLNIDELDEDDMLMTIQTYLQRRAAQAQVDATNHAEWDAFLGVRDAPSCAARFAGRAPRADAD